MLAEKNIKVTNPDSYGIGDLVLWNWGRRLVNRSFGIVVDIEYMKIDFHDGYSKHYGPPPMYRVMFANKLDSFTAEELLRVTLLT